MKSEFGLFTELHGVYNGDYRVRMLTQIMYH